MSTEITGLSEDIAKKREEIKRQQAQMMSLQEEFKKKESQIREENQKKIKEYTDDAEQWRLQVYKYIILMD